MFLTCRQSCQMSLPSRCIDSWQLIGRKQTNSAHHLGNLVPRARPGKALRAAAVTQDSLVAPLATRVAGFQALTDGLRRVNDDRLSSEPKAGVLPLSLFSALIVGAARIILGHPAFQKTEKDARSEGLVSDNGRLEEPLGTQACSNSGCGCGRL